MKTKYMGIEEKMSTLFDQYLALKKGNPKDATPPILDTRPIPFETLENLYRARLDDLNRDYLEGCLGYMSKAHPELLHEAHEAENRLNEVWIDATRGKAAMESFERALETWHRAYLACFEAYSKRPQGVETGRLFR